MTNPAVFYNKEDQWDVPAIEGSDAQPERMEPYYTIMKLPGEETRRSSSRWCRLPRAARTTWPPGWWPAATASTTGASSSTASPKQKVVFGPRQVVARINQDQVISPQITLWNQQGSQVIQGTLLVIPVEESLIYIRPLYLRSAGGRIPELKRVIVAYQNQIVMDTTLEAALDRLFGAGATAGLRLPTDVPGPGRPDRRRAPRRPPRRRGRSRATGAFARRPTRCAPSRPRPATLSRRLDAQRQGNWALYGEEIKRLGDVLQRMDAARQER